MTRLWPRRISSDDQVETERAKLPTLAQIREARARIAGAAIHTPLVRLNVSGAPADIWLKLENLQPIGSFKIRGASNMVFSLTPEQLSNGVVAFSSGNHAQATALAARHVGARATIVMPLDAPRSKVAATRDYGAEIVTYDRFTEDRIAIGNDDDFGVGDNGGVLVGKQLPPTKRTDFNSVWIVRVSPALR